MKALTASKTNIQTYASLETDSLICVTINNTADIGGNYNHEKDTLPIQTRTGRIQMSPEEFMTTIEAFQPDIFHALCDGDTTESSSKKRTIKSADRSTSFFIKCLDRFKESERLKSSLFIGTLFLIYYR